MLFLLWFLYSIDDIEDNSDLRRGIPSAHIKFGLASALNSANYVYFVVLDRIEKELPREIYAEASKIYARRLLQLHQGQGEKWIEPTYFNEYFNLFTLINRNGHLLER